MLESHEKDFFDTMEGEFEARLKMVTRTTRSSKNEGREITVSNPLAIIEARFSYKVLDRLYFPNFVAIERSVDGDKKYVLYEVVGVTPTHYQLPGIDSSMPTLLRKEYLDTINESWGKSQETWIDLTAIPTNYCASVASGGLEFSRAPYAPLPGARALLLSKPAVEKFLCVAGGVDIGTMVGFDLPFTVDMDSMIRYHMGAFGFTGAGKSNLTSGLLRTALARDPMLAAVVFDIAGEYAVNLLDLLKGGAKVYTTEIMDNAQEFVSSQAIPETLEGAIGRERIERELSELYKGGVERLSLQDAGGIDLAWIQSLLQGTVDSGRTGGTSAKIGLTRLTMSFYEKRGNRPSTRLTDLNEEARDELSTLLKDINQSVNERSGLRNDLDLIIKMLEPSESAPKGAPRFTPEVLAEQLVRGTAPRLSILYMPDPYNARAVATRLIRRLLYLKKRVGNKQRLLILLDEAQEYIPDEPTDRDFSRDSNLAVEQLLRQGRKYRLHCWMATQRVARLNVNALQQLHSYFVSTLPRMYDRMVIADAFALPYEVLERSADLGTGEWLFVSFKAAKQRNVPVFLKTENNEKSVADTLTP
ncbi:MAG: ATP-binding protein [Nitrososphaerota archaeon]|nr:ATP-binding protein [Nitrososphaerota archaeon]MDG6990577.1 ATP-binding protein [Nitrososphaerota archaeon]